MFKAVELDATTRRRTGREYGLDVQTRQAAVDALLGMLGVAADQARIDPTKTLLHVSGSTWTIVAVRATDPSESSSLRRGGAKHKRVR